MPDADLDIDDGAETPPAASLTDRVWLIQCKREKSIGPSQMRAHLAAIPAASASGLHGFLFVAACDFSLKTREVLREWCRQHGVSECIVWGRGELEDLLFQPQNDGLLFAYFGISIRLQRQRVSTELRRTVALKRKLKRLFGDESRYGRTVLLRDPSDDRYPYVDGDSLKETKSLWLPRNALGIGVFGLRIVTREFWAYYDYDTQRWDFASGVDLSIPSAHENPWYELQRASEASTSGQVVDFWNSLPKDNQFFFQAIADVPYEDIIEIDDVGDDLLKAPAVFVKFSKDASPYVERTEVRMRSGDSFAREAEFSLDNHALVFPDELRNPIWEERFFQAFGVPRGNERLAVTLTEPEWKRVRPDGEPSAHGTHSDSGARAKQTAG